MNSPRTICTLTEAADALGLSARTTEFLVERGVLTAVLAEPEILIDGHSIAIAGKVIENLRERMKDTDFSNAVRSYIDELALLQSPEAMQRLTDIAAGKIKPSP